MSALALANQFVDAFGAKDSDALVGLMSADVVLDGPFPLGNKTGPDKAASTLLSVGKLGVELRPAEDNGGTIESEVVSPAGAMILAFTSDGDKITRLDVRTP